MGGGCGQDCEPPRAGSLRPPVPQQFAGSRPGRCRADWGEALSLRPRKGPWQATSPPRAGDPQVGNVTPHGHGWMQEAGTNHFSSAIRKGYSPGGKFSNGGDGLIHDMSFILNSP